MALLDRFERFLDQVIPAPEEAVALTRRGELLLRADDPDGALRLADAARALAPGYLRALALRCDALTLLARPFDALAALDAAAAERALPVELLARMAELVAAHGPASRVAELDAHVRVRLRGADRDIAERMLRGAEALSRWDPSLALRYARTATLADPSLSRAWAMLGEDAAARGELPRARALLARAASTLPPADPLANARVGALADALGDHPLASTCLRRAWIAGDDGESFARLVGALAGRGDVVALSRLLTGAGPVVSAVARAVLAAEQGDDVAPALDGVEAAAVPSALWSLALRAALRGAPEVAARWVRARPEAPHADAVTALASLRDGPDAPLDAVARAASAALGDAAVGDLADDALRDALRGRWMDALPRCLDELPRLLAGAPLPAALIDTISLRRKEIDEVLRVAVLGEFSAGKSTFVNALVGREVSPMGVLPTTASVHWLRFGDPLARVLDARGAVTECAVGDAAAVVRRRRREGVATERVEVTLPLPTLASVELIDTPGFNAGDDEHERAGRAAMALADLALWLFDARQAGKDSERGPLRSARDEALPVLGVLNKCDHLDAAGLAQVLAVLGADLGELAPCVAAVSSRAALKAASEGAEDPSWARFERWLAREVTDRRDLWKRARVARRAARDIVSARSALDGHAGRRGDVQQARAALLAELDGLRDALRDAVAQARKELAPALTDQARVPRGASPDDAAALLDDAAAETVWRATRAAKDALRPRLDAVERLAVRAEVLRADAAELVSAPVGVWLELAVRDAARDATESRGDVARESGRWLARALPAVDPLSALRALLDRAVESMTPAEVIARVALEIAAEVCARCEAPRPAPAEMLDAMTAPNG
jgi:GTP-binding protein EngB required for normal cell division/tetratricopeptide (TPR) repeat protein